MSSLRGSRARALFERALELAPEKRAAFLEDSCRANPALVQEVQSLLRAHEASEGFLRSDQLTRALEGLQGEGADPLVGSTIGSYRVLALLGRGGMGAVYEAEQDNPRRRVALKLVDRVFVTPLLLRRFEVEALVLARLKHPGIAHVYEAGTHVTDLGDRPYFAMELVEGLPITAYAREQDLDREERLEVLIRVCEAVQHAHRVGVIHRDLKPANILVTREGQPKILDFGVARCTDTDLQVTTMAGSEGVLVGTLPYMSPEQVRGNPDDLDTRSDVYALGVLCFELLTGQFPHDLEGKTLTDAIRTIVDEDPRTLGAVAAARFPADLETIVATALEGDKERRYGSASDFAADLRRFLLGRPIDARPQGALYQFRKLVLRNRVPAALLAGLVLLSVSFAVVMGFQARRTARERDRANLEADTANEVSGFLESLFHSADPEQALGENPTARELLDRGAARIDTDLADQPLVRTRLLVLMGKVYDSLGHGDRAEPLLEEAVELGRRMSKENIDAAARSNLGEGLRMLARQRAARQRHEEAITLCREALALSEAAYGDESRQYATCLNSLAYHLALSGETDESRALIRRGLELRERLLGPVHVDVGWSRYQYAWLLTSLGEPEKAREEFEKACAIWDETYPENHPQIANCLFDLAGLLIRQDDLAGALAHYERVHAIRLATLGPDHRAVAELQNNLGYLKWRLGELEEALAFYSDAIATYKRALGPGDPGVARGLASLAIIADELGEADRAEAALRERLDLARTYHGDDAEMIKEAEERLAAHREGAGSPAP